jgi:glycosyltransferase involved in cell wall biosynthesis
VSLQDFAGKISVIMPAFNEEQVVYHSIQETASALAGYDYEIIVVDDGSSDRTYLESQRATLENPCVRAVRYGRNGGKGHALRYGFDHCSGDLVAFLDADLDLHPRQLHTLYRVMQETGADVVIGSKRHPESRLDYPWHRKLFSTVYFRLVKALFGLAVRDTQTGIKLFRHAVLADAFPRIQTMGYAYDLELLVAATRFGHHIAEAPVELSFQRQPQGRIGVRSILAMSWDTLCILYRASFWKWLHPGNLTKFWMVAFVAGLVIASFGVASVLTFLHLPPWVSQVSYYVTLKFIPRVWRNVLLVSGGMVVTLVSLIELNKSVMRAFARADDGDLAGIIRVPLLDSSRSSTNKEYSITHLITG